MAEVSLEQLAQYYFAQNYDYLYLKAMLQKASSATIHGSTLITGSSHALNAVYEPVWMNAVNCSMHSQDLYYDFQCAKRVLETPEIAQRYERCFIVMGYYIAFQDLSRSKVSRESMISNIYYPIFGDAHNWEEPVSHDPWADLADIPLRAREICERAAIQQLLKHSTYYSPIRARGSFFDLGGRKWAEVSEEEWEVMGQYRANSHNKIFQHKDSFRENKDILKEFVDFLDFHRITPVVVITPFTEAYNRYVLPEMKEAVLELVDSVPKDVHYVDFNDTPQIFDPTDFMDTDHLSASGAQKVSIILSEMFGV